MSDAQSLQSIDEPLTGARKAYFENLRKKHVPRYLFRAWSNRSGGGPNCTINSTNEIIPRRFMPGANRQRNFYELNENLLLALTRRHFEHELGVITGYSSWAASLHLVLCYAKSMDPSSEPHIAVMDTQDLDSQVFVWQCVHLLGHGHEEYLAWGYIRGRGYKAVPLSKLEDHGLLEVFSELKDGSYRAGCTFEFGDHCRSVSFAKTPAPVAPSLYKAAENVARPFGNMFLPVFTALLCLQPRPGLSKNSSLDKADLHEVTGIGDVAGAASVLNSIRLDDWLRPDQVDTKGFPDVQQWITLLRALVQHQVQRDLKKAQPQPASAAVVPAEPKKQAQPQKMSPPQTQPDSEQHGIMKTAKHPMKSVPNTQSVKAAQQFLKAAAQQYKQPTLSYLKKLQPAKPWKNTKKGMAHIVKSFEAMKIL